MRHPLFAFLFILSVAAFAAAQRDIRAVDFRNFTYAAYCASDETENVTVKNGEFSSEKQADGYVDRFYFNVFEVSYGDINGDRNDEAIVLTVCNTGGTGNFSEGFVFGIESGKAVLLARIPGGDRAYGGLRSARVEGGLIVVESNDVGETGGACCPEFIVTSRYQVAGGKVTPVGTAARRPIYPSQRVRFAPGTSGTTLKVTLPASEGKRFIVGARAGQTLTVSVSSDKAELRLLDDVPTTRNVSGFTAKLTAAGDYTVELANYEDRPLIVTLNIRIR
jgi:hypothetical protein